MPILAVNAAHLVNTSTVPSKAWLVQSLQNRVLKIGDTGADTNICSQILDLAVGAPSRPVDPGVLTNNPDRKAIARVDLGAGGMTRVDPGVCWHWQSSNPEWGAHAAEWVIDVAAPSVSLQLVDWDGLDPLTVPTLFPLQPANVLDVRILHVLADDLPPEEAPAPAPLPIGTLAPHFGHFYSLLTGSGPEPRPSLAALEGSCTAPPGTCPTFQWAGLRPFNCMLATGA
ncbi:MAG TPA: hypothetical protein VEW03_01165 [Longimicrobiaceae bacterium]|nr:hypothetical protein [Longimicrobiaceae bacterium]